MYAILESGAIGSVVNKLVGKPWLDLADHVGTLKRILRGLSLNLNQRINFYGVACKTGCLDGSS